MTTAQTKDAGLGKGYWGEYVRVNGYAFSPTDAGVKKLAKLLDLEARHIRLCINLYLSA